MYSSDRSFGDWVFAVADKGNKAISAIEAGEIEYQKWYSMTYGLSDAQILALPQFDTTPVRTEADIVRLRYALGAFHDLYSALRGLGVVSQRDRQGDLVPCL